MEKINNIERCSRIFIENEAGEVTICYQGYDIDGNEVAILSQDEFRQWLRAGFVELLVEDEPAGRIE